LSYLFWSVPSFIAKASFNCVVSNERDLEISAFKHLHDKSRFFSDIGQLCPFFLSECLLSVFSLY
jgi:hypothetical protein